MDGKKIAEKRFLKLKERLSKEESPPSLAVVWIGEDNVSRIYIEKKKEALQKIGIKVRVYSFPESVSAEEVKEKIISLKEEGVIVQLPLPQNFNAQEILNCIPPEKDVDLLSEISLGKFYSGKKDFLPPVVGAMDILFKEHKIDVKGKTAVVLGAGRLVGKPVSFFLIEKGATVSVINKHTEDISFFTEKADLVVSGTGVSSILKGEMIKDGAIIIDAGTSDDGKKIKGDVEIKSVREKASFLSAVPGGIGPLVVYVLACNLLGYEY